MELYQLIKKRFKRELRGLSNEEALFIKIEQPFFTEDCNRCRNSFHGVYNFEEKKCVPIAKGNGGNLCCEKTGNATGLCSWTAEALSPEQALDYFHNGGKFCDDYTGAIPSEETIREWIGKRDKVIQKVTGCENLEQLFAVLR